MTSKERINQYFNGQKDSYSKEADLSRIEAKTYNLGTKERKFFEDRAWNCGTMVLKLTSIEQQVIKCL